MLNPRKNGPGFFPLLAAFSAVLLHQLKDLSCPENNKQAACGRPTVSASNELFKILPTSYLNSHISHFFPFHCLTLSLLFSLVSVSGIF